jgi:predicted restriction endonuclease
VARALADHGSSVLSPLPTGGVAARSVTDIPALHRLVRRAFQLSRTLPDELLTQFAKKTSMMPRSTETERFVVQRIGQDIFRGGLLDYWDGRCAVTGLAVPELLRASHIKPWAKCDSDAERLDVFNGLLLGPTLDAAFDAGFITVADNSEIIVSPCLSPPDRNHLGLALPLRITRLAEGHRTYLAWHRQEEFRR